jgi:hypothetical protein
LGRGTWLKTVEQVKLIFVWMMLKGVEPTASNVLDRIMSPFPETAASESNHLMK